MQVNEAVSIVANFNSPKWKDLNWVRGQLRNHVDEISTLQSLSDPHTLAELTDYEIILGLAEQEAGMPSAEIRQWRLLVPHQWAGVQDVTESSRVATRLEKFISKIHL